MRAIDIWQSPGRSASTCSITTATSRCDAGSAENRYYLELLDMPKARMRNVTITSPMRCGTKFLANRFEPVCAQSRSGKPHAVSSVRNRPRELLLPEVQARRDEKPTIAVKKKALLRAP